MTGSFAIATRLGCADRSRAAVRQHLCPLSFRRRTRRQRGRTIRPILAGDFSWVRSIPLVPLQVLPRDRAAASREGDAGVNVLDRAGVSVSPPVRGILSSVPLPGVRCVAIHLCGLPVGVTRG